MQVGLGPGHIVLDGDSTTPYKKGAQSPIFGLCLLWPNGRPFQLLLSTCFVCLPVCQLGYPKIYDWIFVKFFDELDTSLRIISVSLSLSVCLCVCLCVSVYSCNACRLRIWSHTAFFTLSEWHRLDLADIYLSERCLIMLVRAKCIPILLYRLECFHLGKADLQSLDFIFNRLCMKVLKLGAST